MKIYKIRVTGEVLETANATRRVNMDGEVLTFGREPVYVRAAELPLLLGDDRYLRIEAVDSAPSGVEVIDLKSERVQEPAANEALPETKSISSRSASRSRRLLLRRRTRRRRAGSAVDAPP